VLPEQSESDPHMGRFLPHNYSGYLVPTNADIAYVDAIFAGEFDADTSPIPNKGLGELTAASGAYDRQRRLSLHGRAHRRPADHYREAAMRDFRSVALKRRRKGCGPIVDQSLEVPACHLP